MIRSPEFSVPASLSSKGWAWRKKLATGKSRNKGQSPRLQIPFLVKETPPVFPQLIIENSLQSTQVNKSHREISR